MDSNSTEVAYALHKAGSCHHGFYLAISILLDVLDAVVFGMTLWEGIFGVSATKSGWLLFFGVSLGLCHSCFRGELFSLHPLPDFMGLETVANYAPMHPESPCVRALFLDIVRGIKQAASQCSSFPLTGTTQSAGCRRF